MYAVQNHLAWPPIRSGSHGDQGDFPTSSQLLPLPSCARAGSEVCPKVYGEASWARNEICSWDLHHCDQHEWSISMMSILLSV